ncbi:BsuPI-related putative proteinase inhibitor [Aquibacillus albus]|uniref:Intracellular proteinase inhibitor BsuPI domain-containing protein n=1 Tax=Aquibacillus albus TaxID=1168171 RepID=A0ABS2N5M4_9BACI|nr:BsuPI-related putative proteinase inhibitor [Aquibacillus albus]MBM7573418.1 hypothetical protein [Aquibacillus albus]
MIRKGFIVLFSIFSLLLVGCGVGNVDASKNNNQNDEKVGEMVPSLEETSPLIFSYTITNQSKNEVTLEFSSSQRFDYAVYNDKGEQIYLFSSLASFLQVVGEEKVKPGEKLEYTIDINEIGLSPGNYTLSAWMTPKTGKKYEVSQEFNVE